MWPSTETYIVLFITRIWLVPFFIVNLNNQFKYRQSITYIPFNYTILSIFVIVGLNYLIAKRLKEMNFYCNWNIGEGGIVTENSAVYWCHIISRYLIFILENIFIFVILKCHWMLLKKLILYKLLNGIPFSNLSSFFACAVF